MQRNQDFQLGSPGLIIGAGDPRHALQGNGGLQDQWCVDDGDILCHPILVLSYVQAFDTANAKIGAARYPQKTEVICYVADLDAALPEWRINNVRPIASVTTAARGSITLGVGVGPHQYIADQLLAKTDVIRAMHERVQLAEFSLLRGVSRINGFTILQEIVATEVFEGGQTSLERLFPGCTEDGLEQATLSASQSGIGKKSARDVASPGTLRSTRCSQTANSGLLPKQPLLARLGALIEAATAVYLDESMTQRNPQQGCICNKQPKQWTNRGSKQTKDTTAHTPRTQQGQKSSKADPPHKTTTTPNQRLPHFVNAVSVHRSSKHSYPCCLTEPDCDA